MSTVTDLQQVTPEIGKRRVMDGTMQNGLNRQLKAEMSSSYIYLGMATYFEKQSLSGFASWFRAQAKEEMEHAMKIYHFLCDRGADVSLSTIEAPKTSYESPLDAFQTALAQEQEISLNIQELYGTAQELREFDAAIFLQWFLEEQVEEENLIGSYISKLQLGSENMGMTLLMLDSELGKRSE